MSYLWFKELFYREPYHDLPIKEAVERAKLWIEKKFLVFQKFTCENCGNRLTIEEPNKFFEFGTCDKCGHTTKIEKCGFSIMTII